MAALNPWQKEILDGFREQLAEFPAAVQVQGTNRVCPCVLHNGATSELEELLGGRREKVSITFSAERADLVKAGIVENTQLKLVGNPVILFVKPIVDDPADPVVRVSAHELA